MKIDRSTAKDIQKEVADFINTLEDKYGIAINKSSTSFTEGSISLKYNCVVTEDNRDDGVLTTEEQRYDHEASIHGLPARGTIFTNDHGEYFIIKEWIPKGRKYKIVGVRVHDDKRYKFPVSVIKDYMKLSPNKP